VTSELGRTIQQTLEEYTLPGVSSPYFAKVFRGEPQALMPTNRALARWHVIRSQVPPEGARVLTGARQVVIVYLLNCYWPLSASEDTQGTQEDDIATVLIDLPNRFIDLTATDYTIGGYPVALLTVEDTSEVQRVIPFPDSNTLAEMRVIQFELHARVLEAS
jgi:hypothetical protein